MGAVLKGNAVEVLMSRESVASELGVSKQWLAKYLDIGSLLVPSLKRFRNSKGGLEGREKLTNWDIEPLRTIQGLVKKHGSLNAEIYVAKLVQEGKL